MDYLPCKLRVSLAGQPTCLHHGCEYYRDKVSAEDCNGCGLRVTDLKSLPKISFLDRARNLSKALVDAAKDGFKLASKDEYLRRISICDKCDFRVEDTQCGLCGCNVLGKAQMQTWECPAGFWEDQPQGGGKS